MKEMCERRGKMYERRENLYEREKNGGVKPFENCSRVSVFSSHVPVVIVIDQQKVSKFAFKNGYEFVLRYKLSLKT